MFFQGSTDAANDAAAQAASQTYAKFSAVQDELKQVKNTVDSLENFLKGLAEPFERLGLEAEELNKNFLQG